MEGYLERYGEVWLSRCLWKLWAKECSREALFRGRWWGGPSQYHHCTVALHIDTSASQKLAWIAIMGPPHHHTKSSFPQWRLPSRQNSPWHKAGSPPRYVPPRPAPLQRVLAPRLGGPGQMAWNLLDFCVARQEKNVMMPTRSYLVGHLHPSTKVDLRFRHASFPVTAPRASSGAL